MKRAHLLLTGLILLATTGCGSSSNTGAPPDPGPVGALSKVTDRTAFEASIKDGLAAMTAPEVLAAAGDAQSGNFTGTYTQDVNVDELDAVRYDGEHLYVAPRRYFHCCFILEDAGSAPPEPPPETIRILATDPANGSASQVGEIPLDANTSVQGMYVDGGRMFAMTAEMYYGNYGPAWTDVAIWAPEKHGFKIYDVSDPSDPMLELEATLDGVFVQSRRIGNTVYIISRYTPWIEGLHYYVSTAQQQSDNQALLAQTTLDDLLPKITIGGETRSLVQPENCYVTTESDGTGNPVLTSITAIPLDDPGNFTTACYNESTYGVYVSENALYFAELRPDSAVQNDVTRIHKFALSGTTVSYRGSADIDGTVWQGNQADFRLNERAGDLRILASQFDWNSPDFVDHQLYILRESATRPELEIVSTLPNSSRPAEIGKPNEALFGVRFTDDKAYAVTFEQIDPLYVIDLADPADPYIAGELEVTGVSDFLHPVNDALLLGLGRGVGGGVKVELFDVSDIAQPLSRGSALLGGPGSYSEAVYDRHAFTYQADVDGVDRFTLPANVFASDGSYQYLGSALYLFEILDKDMPSLAALNSVGSIAPPAAGSEPAWVERSRAYLHGDTVYYVRDEEVWAAAWQSPSLVNGPF
jgi:hypothetical protein